MALEPVPTHARVSGKCTYTPTLATPTEAFEFRKVGPRRVGVVVTV